MTQTNFIIPRKLSGFMELEPRKQLILDEMKDSIREIYNRYGFMPLDTPVLELSEILLAKSGGDIDKELYHFTKGDTDVCMRYDLTVPLARFVAMNSDSLSFPFKRYQIGKVFRGEKAQKGRFREFIQCDADIVGLDELPLVADAECLNIVDKVFKKLGLDIVIHVSNRNILFGLCEGLGLKDKTIEILTILDKLGKIGKENAIRSLEDLGVETPNIDLLIKIAMQCGAFEDVISKIETLCDNETYKEGIEELKELDSYLNAFGIEKNRIILDTGIVRGHNYYTGTVFETVMPSHPEFGAICAGGRYDNLAGYYTDKKMPGVGLSIGLTRLFDLLDRNNMLPPHPLSNVKLELIPLGDTLAHCLTLQNFFNEHITCEVNYSNRSFKSKMKEANKREIPYIIVVGENEVESGQYSLKNMFTGEQFTLTKEECLEKLKN